MGEIIYLKNFKDITPADYYDAFRTFQIGFFRNYLGLIEANHKIFKRSIENLMEALEKP